MSSYNPKAKPFNPNRTLKDEFEKVESVHPVHPVHHMQPIQPVYHVHPMQPMHQHHYPHPYLYPHHYPYPHQPMPVPAFEPPIRGDISDPKMSSKSSPPKIEVLETKKVTRDVEIQTEPIKEEKLPEIEVKEKEQTVKKHCNCRCVHSDTYPIPKGYSPEEAALWKKIRPSTKLTRVSNTLCVGEPGDLSFVRMNMLQYKFKLSKQNITDNKYFIKSVKTPETSPEFMDFQVYYHDDNQMPYKTFIRLRTMSKIQEYDVEHNCRLTSKITIPKESKKIYKQTFDYVKKQKLLEVTDSETHEVLHTEMLTGECWLENEFIYR